MGVFIREKSLVYRIRDDGELTIEAFGPLHKPDSSRTITVHTLGYLPGRADKTARMLERQFRRD